MAEGKRGPGRPPKFDKDRMHLSVRCSKERHADLKQRAAGTGRSVSEMIEFLVEKALIYDDTLAAMRTGLPEQLEAALSRLGWLPIHNSQTGERGWCVPNRAGRHVQFGFEAWEPGEQESLLQHSDEREREIHANNARAEREYRERQPIDPRELAARQARLDALSPPKKEDDAA